MSKIVDIHMKDDPGPPLLRARWCASFLCRLRGLMFRRQLPDGLGLVLVEKRDGVTNTSIHMFAVPFSIGVLWVNNDGEVVDKIVARPWRIYAPAYPARFTIEGPPEIVDNISISDNVEFRDYA